MYYLFHPEYGLIEASSMPLKNVEQYIVLTEEEYNVMLQERLQEEEENEINQQNIDG